MLNKVFVYGTLKPGLRYHSVAQQGGKFTFEEASIEGFDLYHLSPENYPAIREGTHRIHGWCFTYDDIDLAMPFLDELEGVDSDPPDYKRIQTQLYPKHSSETDKEKSAAGTDPSIPLMTWVYVFQDHEGRCQQTGGSSSATFIPDGVWLPRDDENGCLVRVEMETQSLIVIQNQPLVAMDSSVEAVRAFLTSSRSLQDAQEWVATLQVVTRFPALSSSLPRDEQQNDVGVIVPPHICSTFQHLLSAEHQHLQPQLQQGTATASVTSPVTLSSLPAGSYVQYIYRGPYYGLTQAWADFSASIASADSTFEAVEGAPYFHIFVNYGENTLAADLRTDLYIRVK